MVSLSVGDVISKERPSPKRKFVEYAKLDGATHIGLWHLGGGGMVGEESDEVGGVANSVLGNVSGSSLQARDISVHIHTGSGRESRLGPVYLPHLVGDLFVGRSTELARLDAAFTASASQGLEASRVRSAIVQQSVGTVHGLGGIGKSTLAAHWAAAHLHEHTATWWITADSPVALAKGLAGLAAALEPAQAGQRQEALAEKAITWLATHDGWLLILDNVRQPGDVEPLLARLGDPGRTNSGTRGRRSPVGSNTLAPGGRVLITTRLATGWSPTTGHVIGLDVPPIEQAVDLLTRTVARERPDIPLNGAQELCAELGCFPLAIKNASGYIVENNRSPREYLELLANYPADLYAHHPTAESGSRTVARVWHATLDQLATLTPHAGEVLRILAWLSPEQIPRTLLDPLADEFGGMPVLDTTLGRLAAYNMVTWTDGALSVHRLVQAVTRTPDPGDHHRQPEMIDAARRCAIKLLNRALPDEIEDPTDWPKWRTLLPHIDALIGRASSESDDAEAIYLINSAALFLNVQGEFDRAIAYLERTLAASQRPHNIDQTVTLAVRSNLAVTCLKAGRADQLIPLFEHTLNELERTLGNEDRRVLAVRDNLAIACRKAGHLSRAAALLEQTLADKERVLGRSHRETLVARNNLASVLLALGELDRAISLDRQTLADRERVLGKDDPHTVTSRSNLAGAYQEAGDLARAIPLFKEALADCKRVLHKDHPSILDAYHNLAIAYEKAGNLGRAIPLFERIVVDLKKKYGSDSYSVLRSYANLARAFLAAGKADRVIPVLKHIIVHCERSLDVDHPDSLRFRYELAIAYMRAGHLGQAIVLLEQSIAKQKRILGNRHPHVTIARHHLAAAYCIVGDFGRAIPLWEQVLSDCDPASEIGHTVIKVARDGLKIAKRQAIGHRTPLYVKVYPTRVASYKR